MDISAKSIQTALDSTEAAADLDPEFLEQKITEKRQRLESLNDEVEEARQDLQDAQAALAEAEMKEMDGENADVDAAEERVATARQRLEDRKTMLEARQETLKSSIEDLKERKKAAEVRREALKAKELNEEAITKIRTLYEKVEEIEDLNAQVADLLEEAWQLSIDCHYPDVRGNQRRKSGAEVKPLFIRGLGHDVGPGAPHSGMSASGFLEAARAMFEENDRRYWPSFVRSEDAGEDESIWSLFSS